MCSPFVADVFARVQICMIICRENFIAADIWLYSQLYLTLKPTSHCSFALDFHNYRPFSPWRCEIHDFFHLLDFHICCCFRHADVHWPSQRGVKSLEIWSRRALSQLSLFCFVFIVIYILLWSGEGLVLSQLSLLIFLLLFIVFLWSRVHCTLSHSRSDPGNSSVNFFFWFFFYHYLHLSLISCLR